MAVEKKWLAVTATPLTADGTSLGIVTVANTAGFKVKGTAFLAANTLPVIQVQIQRVLSSTQMIVGPVGSTPAPNNFTDISAYTVALNATIGFPEQDKNNIPDKDHYIAVYEGDPTVADRVIPVDQYGRLISQDNPLPVAFDGTIAIGDVTVVGTTPAHYPLEPNADGSINVNIVDEVPTNQKLVLTYNEDATVVGGVSADLVSYTVPIGKTSFLTRIDVSGENIAQYTVLINSVIYAVKRTYFGGNLNTEFTFGATGAPGYFLNSGDVVSVQVLHNRPASGPFEGTIQVVEIS